MQWRLVRHKYVSHRIAVSYVSTVWAFCVLDHYLPSLVALSLGKVVDAACSYYWVPRKRLMFRSIVWSSFMRTGVVLWCEGEACQGLLSLAQCFSNPQTYPSWGVVTPGRVRVWSLQYEGHGKCWWRNSSFGQAYGEGCILIKPCLGGYFWNDTASAKLRIFSVLRLACMLY